MLRLLAAVGITGTVPVYGSVEGARRADPADRIEPIHDDMIDDVHT